MRWTLFLLLALVAALVVFLTSPYVALYRLAAAVEARDTGTLQSRVNLRAVRISLTRQLVGAWLAEREKRNPSTRRPPGMGAAGIGATVADPLVAQMIAPEALLGLLGRGWPTGIVAAPAATEATARAAIGPQGLGALSRLVVEAQPRGFRVMIFSLPPGGPAASQIKLVFRLQGLRWRVTGIDLPDGLVEELVKTMPEEFG